MINSYLHPQTAMDLEMDIPELMCDIPIVTLLHIIISESHVDDVPISPTSSCSLCSPSLLK